MTFNVDSTPLGSVELAAAIRAAAADIVCLQEARSEQSGALSKLLPGYLVRGDGQFVVASKYPIVDVYLPPRIVHEGAHFDVPFVRYRIDAPGGLIDLYNIHPVSPHGSFDKLEQAARACFTSSRVAGSSATPTPAFRHLGDNAQLRELQVRAVADHAGAAPYPVIIVGDTNLPSLSRVLAQSFGAYQDGFVEAGRGFGYTFPAHRSPPWLRLDRIMADRHFRFVSFSRLFVHLSTHYPVVADLERVTGRDEPNLPNLPNPPDKK